jgi:hypothetical protein
MKAPTAHLLDEEDVAVFFRAILSAWRGEPWTDMESNARCVWEQVPGLGGRCPWDDASNSVREVWERLGVTP